MTTNTSKGGRRGQSALTAAGSKAKGGGKPKGSGKPQSGKKGRKPSRPVRVGKERNWGAIAMFVVVGMLAAGIIGYAFWAQRGTEQQGWEEQAAAIEGIVNYRETDPDMLTQEHQQGTLQYQVEPPVGGNHNPAWQDCQGTVYPAQIANEHAVHALEHGAVWITYNPDQLPTDQVDTLADLVEGTDKLFMSPYPGLDAPISLQAWGYQLKADDAGDPGINDFVRTLRINASLEGPSARCDGVTATGTTPQNVGDQTDGQ